MKQYLDVEYAFRHPEGQQRFKVIHLKSGVEALAEEMNAYATLHYYLNNK